MQILYFGIFGDGVSSTELNPSITYATPGNYFVSLLVKSPEGCTDLKNSTIPITIQPKPVVDFSVINTQVCGLDSTFNFINNSTGATTYQWDFGDGNQSALSDPQPSVCHFRRTRCYPGWDIGIWL